MPTHSSNNMSVAMDLSSALLLDIMCYNHTLETKHASMEWKHCGLVKFKVVESADCVGHHVPGPLVRVVSRLPQQER